MKIKALYIRNIASIEKADIDFEKGLNDGVSGDPASVFLISGDTGTGKSVILDSIALALYKKTPRLEDVSNSKVNNYTNIEGESVQVASIVQYTRLGIAPKDPCYCEVTFEGNDGKTYHARLTLGMMVGKKDKLIKHKKPLWEVKTGEADWTKDDVEETIKRAVGLDFKQFGRMAMLAQGQFATFLTGEKKDREDILERLTDTGLFSRYGNAIHAIFINAKKEKERQQILSDSQGKHTLRNEEIKVLNDTIATANGEKGRIEGLINEIDSRMGLIDTVLSAEQQMKEAEEGKTEVEAIMKGEDYQKAKALVADWDGSTDEQRNGLKNLLKARKDHAETVAKLNDLAGRFDQLAADLDFRKGRMVLTKEKLDGVQQWLVDRKQFSTLMLKASTVDLQLADLKESTQKRTELAVDIARQEGEVAEELNRKLKEATALAEAAKGRVDAMQREIEVLKGKLEMLEPAKVDEELNSKVDQHRILYAICQDIAAWSQAVEQTTTEERDIRAEEGKLDGLRKAAEIAKDAYQACKKVADEAGNLLGTMKMSVDDTLVNLRKKMVNEHTETCPLCGQHINHILLADEFHGMLSPLEERQRTAQAKLEVAMSERDKARDAYSTAETSVNTRKTQLEKRLWENSQKKAEIDNRVIAQGFEAGDDLASRIKGRLDKLANEINDLKTKQQAANELSGQIEVLRKDKEPLDQAKTDADGQVANANNAIDGNRVFVGQQRKRLGELETACDQLIEKLGGLLDAYKSDWMADIEVTRMQLEQEARAFNEQTEMERKLKEEFDKASSLIGSIGRIREAIEQAHPKLHERPTMAPSEFFCQDVSVEWSLLQGNVAAEMSTLQKCRQTMADSSAVLDVYYRASGKNEVSFGLLLEQESQLASARSLVEETDRRWTHYVGEITKNQSSIEEAIGKLGLRKREELPDRQPLVEEKAALAEKRDEVVGAIGDALGKLKLNEENNAELERINKVLEAARQRFARWERLDRLFGGSRFRTLVQTYILRPLLNNANIYLEKITDRYQLTCSEENQQLSILVLDRYNKNQVRSATVLSGGERFMISLALSLALSSLKKNDMNVNILFIDEGFGTLDEKNLDSVMATLEKLQEIPGQKERRVGIISHREELEERIPVKIKVVKRGEGRSLVEIVNG